LAYKIICKDASFNIALGVAVGAAIGALIDWLQIRKQN
jgi:hypothetical protein